MLIQVSEAPVDALRACGAATVGAALAMTLALSSASPAHANELGAKVFNNNCGELLVLEALLIA
jgi:hypothetical protein